MRDAGKVERLQRSLELVNSAIAAYYYLRLIVVMYMGEGDDSVVLTPVPVAVAASLILAAGLTIYMGVAPDQILEMAKQGAQAVVK